MYEFKKNNNILFVEKPPDLSFDMFFEKYWFIISQKGDINKNYNYLDKMSEIWINYKFRKCFYGRDVINRVQNMAKNILV